MVAAATAAVCGLWVVSAGCWLVRFVWIVVGFFWFVWLAGWLAASLDGLYRSRRLEAGTADAVVVDVGADVDTDTDTDAEA